VFIDTQRILRRGFDQVLRVNRARHVIVKVRAFRHPEQERVQLRGAISQLREALFNTGLRAALCA
jgi:hypothetical protein